MTAAYHCVGSRAGVIFSLSPSLFISSPNLSSTLGVYDECIPFFFFSPQFRLQRHVLGTLVRGSVRVTLLDLDRSAWFGGQNLVGGGGLKVYPEFALVILTNLVLRCRQ